MCDVLAEALAGNTVVCTAVASRLPGRRVKCDGFEGPNGQKNAKDTAPNGFSCQREKETTAQAGATWQSGAAGAPYGWQRPQGS